MEGSKVLSIMIALAAILVLLVAGMQCQSCQQFSSHVKSGVTGLDRRVTVYANDGSIIREWEGKFNIQDRGGTIRFLDNEGDTITIGGTFVVEENPAPKKPKEEEKK